MNNKRKPPPDWTRREHVGAGVGPYGDDEVVFGLELVAERKDEALRVLLALSDQEHPAAEHFHFTHEQCQPVGPVNSRHMTRGEEFGALCRPAEAHVCQGLVIVC